MPKILIITASDLFEREGMVFSIFVGSSEAEPV